MNTTANMEERLWNYIDNSCTAEEKSFIEQLIETNLGWKAKYKELLELHQLVSGSLELDQPSMRFTQNVMEEIGRYHIAPAAKNYINKKIIWGIGIFFLAMIVGFLIYGFGQINWSEGSSTNLPFDISKVDYSKVFNNTYTNIFMMVNVVLGLMLLDMYLRKKKTQFEQKHHQ